MHKHKPVSVMCRHVHKHTVKTETYTRWSGWSKNASGGHDNHATKTINMLLRLEIQYDFCVSVFLHHKLLKERKYKVQTQVNAFENKNDLLHLLIIQAL